MKAPPSSAFHTSSTSRPSGATIAHDRSATRGTLSASKAKPTDRRPWVSLAVGASTTRMSNGEGVGRRRGAGDFALVEDGDPVPAGVGDGAELRVAVRFHAAALVALPRQAQVTNHLVVDLGAAAVSGEVVADHRAVGAREEDPAL